MKKIIPFILSFILIFSLVPLDVFASDDFGDDNTNTGSHHDDYIEYILAKYGYVGSSYEDILDWLESYNWAIWTFGEDIDDIIISTNNGSRSPKKAVQDIGFILDSHSSSDLTLFIENGLSYINTSNGFTNVLCMPFGMLSPYLPQDYMLPIYHQAEHQKLSFVNGGLSQYRSATCSEDISDFIFIKRPDMQNYNYNTLYNNVIGFNDSIGQNNQFYLYDTSYNSVGHNYYYVDPWTPLSPRFYNANQGISYGSLSSGNYWQWFLPVYTDNNYSSIPIFDSVTSARQFNSGDIPFYEFPYLTTLDDDTLFEFDYDRLRKDLVNAIQNGDWLTPNDLQAILNGTLLKQLELMGLDIKDILLSLQSGLFDEQGQPYLKLIHGQLTVIIDNIVSGGSSADLTETNEKLDEIISLLKVPSSNIDIPSLPDVDVEVDDLLNQLRDTLSAKFPFCIVNDVQLITLLFKAEPVKPELNFTIQLPFTDYPVDWYIDLVWFDNFRDYWIAFCSIAFLVFLLTLSVKIIDALKE